MNNNKIVQVIITTKQPRLDPNQSVTEYALFDEDNEPWVPQGSGGSASILETQVFS